ncbi:hypothetical protein RFI_28814, partial [Reticulomyxa filosa]
MYLIYFFLFLQFQKHNESNASFETNDRAAATRGRIEAQEKKQKERPQHDSQKQEPAKTEEKETTTKTVEQVAGENVEIDSEEYQAKKIAAQELTRQVFEIMDAQHSGDLTWREMEKGLTTIGFDWTQIFKDITAKRHLLEQRLHTLQKLKSHKTALGDELQKKVHERRTKKKRDTTKKVKKIKKSLKKEEDTSPLVKKEEPDTSVTTPSSMTPHVVTD